MADLIELDVPLAGSSDGGVLHVYDTGGPGHVVVWHHGTPNTGHPPEPLLADAERLGLRLVGYDRPGYGGSTPSPDRSVSSAATDAAAVADALGVDRFAAMGHSGGGPHALACAVLLPDRVTAVVTAASLAPYDAVGLDYTAGMCASGVDALAAAAAGREVKEAHDAEHGDDYDPEFTDTDLAALDGEWGWFGSVVRAASASGPAPAIDDDLAYARPWGFDLADLADIAVPVLLLQGGRDRIVPPAHARWLAARIPGAVLHEHPNDGHLSIMTHTLPALEWLAGLVGSDSR